MRRFATHGLAWSLSELKNLFSLAHSYCAHISFKSLTQLILLFNHKSLTYDYSVISLYFGVASICIWLVFIDRFNSCHVLLRECRGEISRHRHQFDGNIGSILMIIVLIRYTFDDLFCVSYTVDLNLIACFIPWI